MRLINGPQIQSPVAGPVNITISFICFHIPSLPNSFTFTSETETISLPFSFSGSLLSTSSLLVLMQEAVTIRFRPFFFVEMSDKVEGKRGMWKRGGCGGGSLLKKVEGWRFWKREVWDVRVLSCIFCYFYASPPQLKMEAKRSGEESELRTQKERVTGEKPKEENWEQVIWTLKD